MPEIQAATRIEWSDGTTVQAATRIEWSDGTTVQSVGSAYTPPPAPPTAPPSLVGSLAPGIDIPAASSYHLTHSLSVVDLRTDPPTALPARSVNLELQDGSDLWTLRAEGDGAMYSTLTTGDQPASIRVTINGQSWAFLVESINAPQSFASSTVTFGGRSPAAAADRPYQAPQQWSADAPTTAAQFATVANTFTGLDVLWLAPDWLVPEGTWSINGSPLEVVRQAAKAVGAVVEADRQLPAVTVRSRYPVLPNKWATTPPDWQVHWQAVQSANYEQADTPGYNALYVTGTQAGGSLLARYAGTNGATQAPMVTDPLLTDQAGLVERATAELASYGKQARVTRTLPVGPQGVIPRGSLVRWVDPDETWVGMVRSVSVSATLGMAMQTVTCERRTAFQSGLFVPPPPPTPADPLWDQVVLLVHGTPVDTTGRHEVTLTNGTIGADVQALNGTVISFDAVNTQALDFANNLSDFNFNSGAWTIEWRGNCTELQSSPRIWFATGLTEFMASHVPAALYTARTNNVGSAQLFFFALADQVQGMHSFALTHDGSRLRGFIDGQKLLDVSSPSPNFGSGYLRFARNNPLGSDIGFPYAFRGNLEEIRLTRACRYTDNYTPATAPFPDR